MPSSYTNVTLQKPEYLATGDWTPQDDRSWFSDIVSPGVVAAGDYNVTFVSGLTVSVAAGVAYIRGQNVADQGTYRQYTSGSHNIAVGAGGVNPRLDQIILRVLDQDHDTSGSYNGVIEVIPGTPTVGATLANRLGAANLSSLLDGSKNVLLLADVLVPTGAGSINSAAIGDKRVRATIPGQIVVPRARVYRTANQTIATGTDTAISFQAERVDSANIWAVSAPTKLGIPKAGFYTVFASIEFAGNNTGARHLWALVNGAAFICYVSDFAPSASVSRLGFSTGYEFAQGDYVEIMVRQTSGGNLALNATPNASPEAGIIKVA